MDDYSHVRRRVRAIPTEVPKDSEPKTRIKVGKVDDGSPRRRPNRGSWGAGQCGNPRGRPRGAKGAKATVRQELIDKVEVNGPNGGRKKKITVFQALIKQEIKAAAEGDRQARRTCFDWARWALAEVEADLTASGQPDPGLTETGKAILDMFADEVRAAERKKAQDDDDGGKQ
jgi:hypothetical protein